MTKAGLIIIVVLLLSLFSSVTTSKPAVLTSECNCSHLEVLQVELRNAQRLQEAFRNKIPELRGMSAGASMAELKRFAQTDARRDLESLPNYKGPGEVDYVAQGDLLYDPTHPRPNDTNEGLCRMSADAELSLQTAMQQAACDGIGKAIKAHEEVHHSSCLRRGYVNFFNMTGADRAQDEVDAYGAQISALRAEIAQVLERSQFTIITDVKTKTTVPQNPLYTSVINENHSEIPTTRAGGTADKFRFDGQGQQSCNASIEGNCKFTGGIPFNLPARVSIETDGLTAEVTYEVSGQAPSLGMQCTIPGAGSGYGMSIPVQLNSGRVPIAKMPLKDGAEVVFDMSQSEAARIMAGGRVTLTGKATVKLKCNR